MTRAERRRAARKLWRSGKFGRKRYNASRRYRRLLWKAQVALATKVVPETTWQQRVARRIRGQDVIKIDGEVWP